MIACVYIYIYIYTHSYSYSQTLLLQCCTFTVLSFRCAALSCSVLRCTTLYYTRRNQKVNLRGKRYSIPEYKSGRKARNLVLREDTKEYDRAVRAKEREARKLMNNADHLFSDDYYLGATPFVNRSSHKVVIGYGRRNPNEVKRTGNRKKKMSKI